MPAGTRGLLLFVQIGDQDLGFALIPVAPRGERPGGERDNDVGVALGAGEQAALVAVVDLDGLRSTDRTRRREGLRRRRWLLRGQHRGCLNFRRLCIVLYLVRETCVQAAREATLYSLRLAVRDPYGDLHLRTRR